MWLDLHIAAILQWCHGDITAFFFLFFLLLFRKMHKYFTSHYVPAPSPPPLNHISVKIIIHAMMAFLLPAAICIQTLQSCGNEMKLVKIDFLIIRIRYILCALYYCASGSLKILSRHNFYRNRQQISDDRCVECCNNELAVMGCFVAEVSNLRTFASHSIHSQYCGWFVFRFVCVFFSISFYVDILLYVLQNTCNPINVYYRRLWCDDVVGTVATLSEYGIVLRLILIGIKCLLTIFICLYMYSMGQCMCECVWKWE